jgi:hypothetical protein
MNKLKLYIESTIASYITARDSYDIRHLADQLITRAFWENERNRFHLRTSRTVLDECGRGDPEAAKRRIKLIEDIELLRETDKAKQLSLLYQQLLNIPKRAKNDAMHLALCVVHEIDLLLTWNCTHLGPIAQKHVQAYNEKHGLWTPALVTPDTIREIIKEAEP